MAARDSVKLAPEAGTYAQQGSTGTRRYWYYTIIRSKLLTTLIIGKRRHQSSYLRLARFFDEL